MKLNSYSLALAEYSIQKFTLLPTKQRINREETKVVSYESQCPKSMQSLSSIIFSTKKHNTIECSSIQCRQLSLLSS